MNCPNCSADMDQVALGGVYGADIQVDLCYPCHVLWLDKRESILLSPGGTLDLFQLLHQHQDDPRHALGSRSACPRCGDLLELLHDIGKSGRFSYWRCPIGHGRLTPFSEFLKEKQFVRSLNPAERARLRAEIKQVHCSSCGAPVDLDKGFECEHCGAPLTVLDADAVSKTLAELKEADAAKHALRPEDAERRARALAAMENFRTRPDDLPFGRPRHRHGGQDLATDLLHASIGILFGGFR